MAIQVASTHENGSIDDRGRVLFPCIHQFGPGTPRVTARIEHIHAFRRLVIDLPADHVDFPVEIHGRRVDAGIVPAGFH